MTLRGVTYDDGAAVGSPEAAAGRYTIDELAAASGVPSRTIRFYQAKGVLPAPSRRGRVAIYDATHLDRLRLVGQLSERGLRLRAIRELLRHGSDARALAPWLDYRERLGRPWSEERPRTVDAEELEGIIGDRPRGTIATLLRCGVIENDRATNARLFRIPSPGLLRITLGLADAGVDIETAVGAGAILRRRLAQAARELVAHFAARAGHGFGRSREPEELAAALDALRPIAGDAVLLHFQVQIERALRDFPTRRPRRTVKSALRRRLRSRR